MDREETPSFHVSLCPQRWVPFFPSCTVSLECDIHVVINLEERSVHKSICQQITISVPLQRASIYGCAPEGIHQEVHVWALNSSIQLAKSFALPCDSISPEKGATCSMGLSRVSIVSHFVSSLGKYFSSLHKSSIHTSTGLISTSFNSVQIKFVEWWLTFSLFF